jgi:hypothetical protein
VVFTAPLEPPVDHGRHVLLDACHELVGLSLRQVTVLDRLLDPRLLLRHERGDQSVDGLVSILGDLREGLAVLELGAKRSLGHAEVLRSGIEPVMLPMEAGTAVAEAEAGPEHGHGLPVDRGLHASRLGLRQVSVLDRLFDPVLQGGLERIRQALGGDPELAGDVVEHRTLLLLRRPQLRRRNGRSGSGDGEREHCPDCDFLDACHGPIETPDPKSGLNLS